MPAARIAVSRFAPAIGAAAVVSWIPNLCIPSNAAMPAPLQSTDPTVVGGVSVAALPNYARTALHLRHWRQPEVVFHITPDPKDKRSPAEVRALVAQGIALWKSKIGSKLALRMAQGNEAADVEIGFVKSGLLGGQRVGNTVVNFTDPQNDIQNAAIDISEGLSSAVLVQTVAHECGHALGIEGHSDDNQDLMFPAVHTPAAISDRDANTLILAYYRIDTSQKVRGFKHGQKFGSAKSY